MKKLPQSLTLLFLLLPAVAFAQTLTDTSAAMEGGGALEGTAAARAVVAPGAAAPAAAATTAAAGAAASASDTPAPAGTAPAAGTVAQSSAAAPQDDINTPFRGSFFLSPLEIAAIQQALNGRVIKAATLAGDSKPVPAYRVIRVSGVLYRSPADWVVWMNNHKVTPDNLLPEIVDISVKDSSKVSLKWYDVGLNQVISITLRPHETYDIPTGILIPGTY